MGTPTPGRSETEETAQSRVNSDRTLQVAWPCDRSKDKACAQSMCTTTALGDVSTVAANLGRLARTHPVDQEFCRELGFLDPHLVS